MEFAVGFAMGVGATFAMHWLVMEQNERLKNEKQRVDVRAGKGNQEHGAI